MSGNDAKDFSHVFKRSTRSVDNRQYTLSNCHPVHLPLTPVQRIEQKFLHKYLDLNAQIKKSIFNGI
jgi:hypothetical protein